MKKIGLGIFVVLVALSLSGMAGAGKLIPVADQAFKGYTEFNSRE